MNTPAIRKLREKLEANRPVYGLWVTLESASISEIAVGLGLDWIVIDAEHGHLDWRDIVAHIRSAVRSDTVVLVRIAELNAALVKRSLDIGADGIVIPTIETAEQLQEAVSFSRYPSDGKRGIGSERSTCWGSCLSESVSEANDHVLVVPLIESVQGRNNLDQIVKVPGVELFFVGPADLSASAGYAGQWENEDVAAQVLAIKDVVQAAGKHCGIVSTGERDLNRRLDQGFQLLGIALDCGLIIRGIESALSAVGRESRIHPTLIPEQEQALRHE